MRILLTGASGYIGRRLIPVLLEEGHEVIALARSLFRLPTLEKHKDRFKIVPADLLDPASLENIPKEIDVAYYLVHSMAQKGRTFEQLEKECGENFSTALKKTSCKQIIYLSGLVNDDNLSPHLLSRKQVEQILQTSGIPVTVLRAGIIIGSGSASFEIIRDLVEKLPVMIAPRWVMNTCQPIAIRDVLFYLVHVIGNEKCLGRTFDIGGPNQLTYREMLLEFAQIRGLRRLIIPVPVLTPRLSSYWLYFVTSVNYPLAQNLVDSLKNDAVCHDLSIHGILPRDCMTYTEAVERAFAKIEQHSVLSSWKDAMTGSALSPNLTPYIQIPEHGCLVDRRTLPLKVSREEALERIWSIGGSNGWYFMDWAWSLRGFFDKVIGGVGLRRGRTNANTLQRGDALDFWRVLLADREAGRLLLYAEMKVPGEAWLEFSVNCKGVLTQTASFRPSGLLGRLYWYILYPFHVLIFKGMAKKIVKD
ncbi:MAG: SDR family oxidoreductase [Chlamydiia bacterium]|nr:SDR family oxidoreductase [Chlamydiia bacterium]